MEAFLVSTGLVALAEMGDKTQLLALMLATRYRKPVPIILGIAVATLLNHAVAAWAGDWVAGHIPIEYFRWIVGGAFLLVAAWTLIPDRMDESDSAVNATSAFIATTIAFFIAEIGDKTQVATVLLAAKYQAFIWVVAGTTLGMMLANVPAVLLGDWMHDRVPMKPIRIGAALLFVIAGVSTMIIGF